LSNSPGHRVYLDWNATAPLRPEAREAMLAAMDVVGNPSSVHMEGRAAKAIVEKARGHVAALVGCEPGEIVFTSGATEAVEQALSIFEGFEVWLPDDIEAESYFRHFPTVMRADLLSPILMCPGIEHDSVAAHEDKSRKLGCYSNGQVNWSATSAFVFEDDKRAAVALQVANGETGVIQRVEKFARNLSQHQPRPMFFTDAVQVVGKTRFSFREADAEFSVCSAHKLGGPKGAGALIVRAGSKVETLLRGGGQELGRRSGTENVTGIAGFGAAAEAAQHDLENGVWGRVAQLRDSLEERLEATAPDLIIFGKDVPRLPNTSCFAIPGWKGETQVIQMDLAGYAISAGSACSSGKVNKASRVLLAMGFDEETASSAIRVSMGPTTTEAEVMGFADTWIEHYRRRRQRAA
jgi:cysteine desulfurase